MGVDLTQSQHYREIVNRISSGNYSQKRSVGFFVTNQGGDFDSGDRSIPSNVGRRGGLNLGEIPSGNDVEDLHNVSAEGEVAEDEEGAHSFGSNTANNEGVNEALMGEGYNMGGSDLDNDLFNSQP